MNHIGENNEHRKYFGQDGSFIEGLTKDVPKEKIFDLYKLYKKSQRRLQQ